MPLPRVLVVCTGNRARSQMAEGWIRHFGQGRLEVRSAGTHPKGVHPMAVEAMAEHGIDISGHTSDPVSAYEGQRFDVVVTVCDAANEACPVFPNADRRVHRAFTDPDVAGTDPEAVRTVFRAVCAEIGEWAIEFVEEALSLA
ncbi:MAG: arsenate reductase ArsC [Fimbriimonadaceae bacterium]|nr:arsenate reductase ArsC [Fimbriimonadaceae bacterium]QYK59249.1 MAG: arsenate reductase ArsC [Fimbriimonadaceae bacterium]